MEPDTLLIWGVGLALVLVVGLPYYGRHRRIERRTTAAEVEALRYGLHEPASLHPVVMVDACIGTGNCLAACPEEDVLGIRDGQAHPVSPARCIGHGLCERACPVDAIQLVFGTDKRGVDLPRVQENFETNVPGLYIVGELGGMGLIGNAFEQGRQCVEGIARLKNGDGEPGVLDILIVGCGPAGLSASLQCQQHGLSFRTLEKEDIGGTVRHYPRKKLVLTRPMKVPGYGKLSHREITKESLIDVWEDIVARTGLEVGTGETVTDVRRNGSGFLVTSDKQDYRSRHVILAIGRRGVPRKLDVPGEDLPKVAYSLREPEAFESDRIAVVGGGDSAVEAALALAEQGNEVTISYRRDSFSRIKPQNHDRVQEALRNGLIDILWRTNVIAIEPERVILKNDNQQTGAILNDYAFIFAGGELPTRFLRACGVEIDTKFGDP